MKNFVWILMVIALNVYIAFDFMTILTTLILQAKNMGEVFIFWYFLLVINVFISWIYLFCYSYPKLLLRFLLKVLFHWLLSQSVIGVEEGFYFCVLVFYPVFLAESVYQLKEFPGWDFRVIYVCNHIICK